MSRWNRLFAVLLAVGLMAAACGSDSDGNASGGDGGDAGSGGSGIGGDAGSEADGDFDPDGVLRIARFAYYTWDPATVPSSFAMLDMSLVYDRLVHVDPQGELIPGLAESWEYADDAMSLTLHLRDGVVFQDGAELDAQVVKDNLDRSITLEGSNLAAELARVSEVTVVDDLTVTIELTEPDATIPAVLADRAGVMVSPNSLDDPQLDQKPVGAGMYKMADLAPGSSFRVERWDGYWDPDAVKLAAIEVEIIPDSNTRVNALTTGQVDVTAIEPFDVARVENSSGVTVVLGDTMRFVYLTLNRGEAPLDDIRVREAITRAIDREALVNGPWLGMGTPTQQIWPEGYFAHVPELTDLYPYDLDRARELLEEAGLGDGFTLGVVVPPQPASYQQLGEAVQAMLAEINITVELHLTEASALGQVVYLDQLQPAAVLYTNGRTDPASTVGDRYTASGFFNPGGHSTDRLQELYEAALVTTDVAARTEIFHDLSTEIVEQLLEVSLFFPQEPDGITDRVIGYVPYLSGKTEFRGVGVRADS